MFLKGRDRIGWKLLEAIKIPSETILAVSLLSNIIAWCFVTERSKGCCSNPHNFSWGSDLLVFSAVKQSWSERHAAWMTQLALELATHPLHFCSAVGIVLISHAPPSGSRIKQIHTSHSWSFHLKGMKITFSKYSVYIACDSRCWLQRPPIKIKMSSSYSAWLKTLI